MQQLILRCLFKDEQHPTVWFPVLVQRMNMSNIQLCMCFPIRVISCLKFEREQHPRHGLVVLVPCLNEALGSGDHLGSSQDLANFESWRVLGEMWMEHVAERLSHLVGLLGKRTDPYVGRHFVSSSSERNAYAFVYAVLLRCLCRCYPLQSSSIR